MGSERDTQNSLFSIDHILSGKTELNTLSEAHRYPPPPAHRYPPPELSIKSHLLSNSFSAPTLISTPQTPFTLGHQQDRIAQQLPFAARHMPLSPPLLSTSWKSEQELLYHNLYLDTILQGNLRIHRYT